VTVMRAKISGRSSRCASCRTSLHRFVLRLAHRHDALRADVTRKDDVPGGEIEHAIPAGRQACGIEELQEDIEDAGMGLLDFIEEQRSPTWQASKPSAMRPASSAVPRRSASRVGRLVFGHVQPDDTVLVRSGLREAERQLGFADTGRPEKHEARLRRPGRSVRVSPCCRRSANEVNCVILTSKTTFSLAARCGGFRVGESVSVMGHLYHLTWGCRGSAGGWFRRR